MKNTLENKAKFFAQYWGQNILRYEPDLGYHRIVNEYKIGNADEFVAELKPLSQITDEDAIEVIGETECHLRQNDEQSGYFGMSPSGIFVDSLNGYGDSYHIGNKQLDFLRSKGYALPYMGISVEQQIEWGWIKLKTK